jgi:hypothetical protein
VNRRDLLRAIALGGGLVAGEIWIPGARKIFLPEGDLRFKATERMLSETTLEDVCHEIVAKHGPLTRAEFHGQLRIVLNKAFTEVYYSGPDGARVFGRLGN